MANNIFQQILIGTSWIDWLFVVVLIYFVATNRGFVQTSFEIIIFLISLVLSYRFYPFFGRILVNNFAISKGFANALGFFTAWFIIEVITYTLIAIIIWPIVKKIHKHPLNVFLGYIVAAIQASVIFLLFVSFIFAFPTKGSIKSDILHSKTGPFFVNLSYSVEKQIKNIFGGAISETINFLTIQPDSDQRLNLDFVVGKAKLTADPPSEAIMYALINRERGRVGAKELTFDEALREVAQTYAKEMFTYGFFSHVSAIDGSTVAERALRFQVPFSMVGENLAYAPDVYLAHQGLMNSEGHRENILHPDFSRVGIGVIDGGIYGKIFVQIFAD